MKHINLLTWFTLMLTSALAQNQRLADSATVITYQSIPENGLELRAGWHYHSGDNPNWAKPDWDDRTWTPVSPWQPPSKLPQIPSEGIGWLRLRFRLGERIRHQPLLLRLEQYGASEVYLNGRLIGRFGRISRQPKQVEPYNPFYKPVLISVTDQSDQVLAIRFSVWPPIHFFSEQATHPVFIATRLITQTQADEMTSYILSQVLTGTFLLGVCLLLILFHTAFFIYNPAQRANLYFDFYACSLAVNASCVFGLLMPNVEVSLLSSVLFFICPQLFFLWLLRAMYALFARRPTVLYYGLWGSIMIGAPIALSNYIGSFLIEGLFLQIPILIALIEQLRLIVEAFRRKQRGTGMIALGFIISAVTLVVIITTAVLKIPQSTGIGILLALMILLSPALCISLYLAREFALDSRLLQLKLVEVQKLSTQTIAQEYEKQQLLSMQNERLEQQVEARTAELKASQNQLIQKEKLASLGELTAGIAHEIQNPLNFVNNFSEVSSELVDELKEGPFQNLPDSEKDYAAEILGDLTSNLQKINHHGGRASSIVKGMLEHSRTESGEKRPTDLNALADEYLKIAYHGLRAKDKGFNCELMTDFDPTLKPVEVAPQEIGRVLLNLFNNAFYAVSERARQTSDPDYRPTVEVETTWQKDHIFIRVKDNGTGIPESVKAKIFQPFFTTKPTGEGTGLGLSLSYDIITKGYGGTLTLERAASQGTQFVIKIPIS